MTTPLPRNALFAAWFAAWLTIGACASPTPVPAPEPFTLSEATIADMTRAMEEGRLTSRELVVQYLTRIATYEDRINAVITVNPHAIEEAEALDRERAAGNIRGPLHGIPIALKDNIQTTDMPTTGGAEAFIDYTPPYDATLVRICVRPAPSSSQRRFSPSSPTGWPETRLRCQGTTTPSRASR